ncbi:MAG: hypothetical protein Q8L75_07195 [Acidobacteriota bacterium]|nr:hypothetical protein [Acidobacteriota bacterium]
MIPWSTFWERNYFVEWSPALEAVLTSNYLRGAISGLGLVNIAVGLVELGDSLASKASQPPADDQP